MQEFFKDILNIDGVKGVMLLSLSGAPIFKTFTPSVTQNPEDNQWSRFIESLDGIRESDIIFEKGRVYIRRTDIGYLVVLLGLLVPMAIIRLNCDTLLPSLTPEKSSKRWPRLFKR